MTLKKNAVSTVAAIALAATSFVFLLLALGTLIYTNRRAAAFAGQLDYTEQETSLKLLMFFLGLCLLLGLFLLVASILVYLIWGYNAYKNLAQLQPTNAPAHRLIWSWFVPFYGLVAPFRMIMEMAVDYVAHIEKLAPSTYKKLQHLDKVAGVYWALFVIMNPVLIAIEAFNANPDYDLATKTRVEGYLEAGTYVGFALLCLLAFLIVLGISRAEKAIIHHQRFDA